MTEASEAFLAGLSDRVRRLLAEPPAMEKMLIELKPAWPTLTGGLARMAAMAGSAVVTASQHEDTRPPPRMAPRSPPSWAP